jgi:Mrp family chromosome partitioning ATPase
MANEFIQSLRNLNESYDVILLDLPPILVESLTQKLADKLDGVVVVLQEGRTKKPDIEETDSLLKKAKTKNLGFIFQR